MYYKEVEITCIHGLHVRPAAQFVKKAKEFESNIVVISGGDEASAKSLFKFQTLQLENGKIIKIQADGSDEKLAVDTLTELISQLE